MRTNCSSVQQIAASMGRAKPARTLLDSKVWAGQSHVLAKSAAYDNEVLTALRKMESDGSAVNEIALSEAYLKAGGHLAETLVVQAGSRLGAVLKEVAAR